MEAQFYYWDEQYQHVLCEPCGIAYHGSEEIASRYRTAVLWRKKCWDCSIEIEPVRESQVQESKEDYCREQVSTEAKTLFLGTVHAFDPRTFS